MPTPHTRIAAAMLVLAAAITPAGLAGAPSEARPETAPAHDVALSKDNLLMGQLSGANGKPLPGATVWLGDGDSAPVPATTDARGRFAYKGVPSGVYCLQAGDSARLCRVWSADAAPPKSIGAVLMVADEQAVRGQSGPPPMINGFVKKSKKFFAHPVGMVVLGAAIATPIVLVAADDDDPPASP